MTTYAVTEQDVVVGFGIRAPAARAVHFFKLGERWNLRFVRMQCLQLVQTIDKSSLAFGNLAVLSLKLLVGFQLITTRLTPAFSFVSLNEGEGVPQPMRLKKRTVYVGQDY